MRLRAWQACLCAAVILCWTSGALANRVHVVQKGETLTSIANRYGVSQRMIARSNGLRDRDHLLAGQKLVIPDHQSTRESYIVQRGDTLGDIAAQHGLTVSDLARYNQLRNPNHLRVGQVLVIPQNGGNGAFVSTLPQSVLSQLNSVRAPSQRWRHIVIHHSGTTVGSAKGIDRYHRERRHMENGLAYHFVIGNGRGMGDGQIFVGNRWKRQLDGGHLGSEALNRTSLGICLIGDFQRDHPTRAQMQSLEALTEYLLHVTGLAPSNVTTHREIQPNHTECPGRYFSLTGFRAKL